MAAPNWKPCVHSVHPRLVYLPPAVKTGDPCDGDHSFSSERILAAESSNMRRTLGASASGVRSDCVSTIQSKFNRRLKRQARTPVPPEKLQAASSVGQAS